VVCCFDEVDGKCVNVCEFVEQDEEWDEEGEHQS
jgi:hypothetical protein